MGGQDATEAFEDVGHSDEAREILEGLAVGTLKRQVRLCMISQFRTATKLLFRRRETQSQRSQQAPQLPHQQIMPQDWASVFTQSSSSVSRLLLVPTGTCRVKMARHKCWRAKTS